MSEAQLSISSVDKDDWRGVTNAAERRRRQNRLNQRAYRIRRRRQADAEVQALEHVATSADQSYILGCPRTSSPSSPVIFPPALRPTPCQRSLPHHPWIGFFPYPTVRDNLIRSQGRYDKHDFCSDIMGFQNPCAADNMLLVWGEPYDPENWEVTEDFIKKWGWVIQGCQDILRSTNKWRALRGESLIFRYL